MPSIRREGGLIDRVTAQAVKATLTTHLYTSREVNTFAKSEGVIPAIQPKMGQSLKRRCRGVISATRIDHEEIVTRLAIEVKVIGELGSTHNGDLVVSRTAA